MLECRSAVVLPCCNPKIWGSTDYIEFTGPKLSLHAFLGCIQLDRVSRSSPQAPSQNAERLDIWCILLAQPSAWTSHDARATFLTCATCTGLGERSVLNGMWGKYDHHRFSTAQQYFGNALAAPAVFLRCLRVPLVRGSRASQRLGLRFGDQTRWDRTREV